MAHPISSLGAVHTVISVLPLVVGLYGFRRYGFIEPKTQSGRIYLAGLTLSVITSFGLSSTGGFNAGHALGILALAGAFGSLLVPRLSFLGGARPYLAAFGLSSSFFLLLVPGINETLTRLPPAHPLADGPASPVVRTTLLVWLVIFIAGYILQVRSIYANRQNAAHTRSVNFGPDGRAAGEGTAVKVQSGDRLRHV
jgi:hypothetical protein